MKKNLPVTQNEVRLPPGEQLVSRTDLKGAITYCNPSFIAVSGYSEQELVGENHNIVRHPDMPPAAFADLWKTVQSGRPWKGLVKNRCKNGDYYWVEANVTPLFENGKVTGYMSVRYEPTREAVAAAEELYRRLNAGTARMEETHTHDWLDPVRNLSLNTKVYGLLGIALGGSLAALVAGQLDVVKTSGIGSAISYGVFAVAALVSLVGAYLVARVLRRPLEHMQEAFDDMLRGEYRTWVNLHREDELGQAMRAVSMLQIRMGFDLSESRRLGAEASRIKIALDNAATLIMVADLDGHLLYVNRALADMMRRHREQFQKRNPAFDPDRLVGTDLGQLHRDLPNTHAQISALDGTQRTTIGIEGLTFRQAISPVMSDSGERLGVCVEWQDITTELKVQDEIEKMVQSAVAGDLGRRLNTSDKEGFTRKLAEGINQLVSTMAGAMEDMAQVLSAVAAGDLTRTIEREYRGSFGKMKDDINATVRKLTDVMSNIKAAASEINTAAGEIASGNTDLSQRTEEQAASLEETASSMEELTSTVRQNADNARQANQLANGARQQAQAGGEVVTKAIAAMDQISSASKKIADIIGVIDEIAFQTNLLALNAAVEAARAGEQGRGFAVVATEVRNLAQRSAQAAKEIKDLIHDSVDKVKSGAELVDQSGETLAQIVESVKKVTDIVAEIAAASHEQSTGIEQVNKAVMQMDQTTQQNAALVEQAAAASKSMEDQASTLSQLVGFFRAKASSSPDGQAAPAAKPRPATAKTGPVSGEQERRGPNRPWAHPGTAAGSSPAKPSRTGTGDEWEEF